eukprot:tig00000444_g807.t1
MYVSPAAGCFAGGRPQPVAAPSLCSQANAATSARISRRRDFLGQSLRAPPASNGEHHAVAGPSFRGPAALLKPKKSGVPQRPPQPTQPRSFRDAPPEPLSESHPHFPPISEEKSRALQMAISQVEKSVGKGAIMRLGGAQKIAVERVPSGALTLDIALGGGLPKGRVIEIFGPEASGKTTLALHAVAAVQAAGGVGVFIDAEHALDPAYAEALGVDVENLLISQPDNAEQALDIMDHFIRSAAVDVVVVDSVAALVPRAEIEGDFGDAHIGLQARLMGQALRKIAGSVSRTGCIVIFLNQLRSKIGVMFGSNEVTTGGNALKFYSTVRMDIRRVQALKHGASDYGARTRVRVVKNKTAPPFRVAEFDIVFGRGIDDVGCLVDVAEDLAVLERKGAWYYFDGENLAQGRDNLVALLREDPAAHARLKGRVDEELERRGTTRASPPEARPRAAPPAAEEPPRAQGATPAAHPEVEEEEAWPDAGLRWSPALEAPEQEGAPASPF